MGHWASGLLYSIVVFFLSLPYWIIQRGCRSLTECSHHRIKSKMKQLSEIVHKGGLPENTIEGIKNSIAKGATAIEVDVQFTSCGVAVLLHDETVDRTTDGRGNVSSMTLEHLQTLKVKTNQKYPDCIVPTLRKLLDLLEEHKNVTLIIDLKLSDMKHIKGMVELFKEHSSLYDNVVVCSFYPHLLYKIRMFDPDLLVGFLSYGPIYSAEKYTGNNDVYRLTLLEKVCFNLMVWCVPKIIGANLLFVYKEDLYNDMVNIKELRANGYYVALYEVGSANELTLCSQKYNTPMIISEDLFCKRE